MKTIILIFLIINVNSIICNDWVKTFTIDDKLNIDQGFELFINADSYLYGLKENVLYSNKENINKMEKSDLLTSLEDLDKILAVEVFKNYIYVLILNKDLTQQLIQIDINNINEIKEFEKYDLKTDSTEYPDRLINVSDEIIYAYSTKKGQSVFYQVHILPNDYNDFYEVKGIFPVPELNKINYRTISDSFILTDVTDPIKRSIVGFLADSLEFYKKIFLDRNPNEFDYYFNIQPVLVHLFLDIEVDSAYIPYIYFNYDTPTIEQHYRLRSIETCNDFKKGKKGTFIFKIYFRPDTKNNRYFNEYRVAELEHGGKFISDFYNINGRIIILYKLNDSVYLYYSDDDGNNWNNFIIPEFKQETNLKFHSYENEIFAYNEDVVYKADIYSSIKKDIVKNDVNLYPNPTKVKININSKDNITELSLYSLNLSKILEFKSNNSTSQEIDVSNLPIGVYFIKVNDDFYKFVKE